jgi:hypothetical protein
VTPWGKSLQFKCKYSRIPLRLIFWLNRDIQTFCRTLRTFECCSAFSEVSTPEVSFKWLPTNLTNGHNPPLNNSRPKFWLQSVGTASTRVYASKTPAAVATTIGPSTNPIAPKTATPPSTLIKTIRALRRE